MDHNELARLLLAACDQPPETIDPAAVTDHLRHAFLRLGSDTPDNRNAIDRIEYGLVRDRPFPPRSVLALKIRNTDVLLSEIVNSVEDLDLPRRVGAAFPALTGQDWHAAMRMVTMVLIALEREVRR